MKLTSRRACAALILLILAGACAWVAIGFSNSRAASRRYKEQLAKNGEKLRVDDVLPPAVPADQNSAILFRRAYSQFTISSGATALETNPPPAMRMVAPGKAMICWQRTDVRAQATNTWKDFADELEDNQDGIKILQRITNGMLLDFGLNYHQGFAMLLPHLVEIKKTAVLLESAAVCDLHQGKPDLAISRIRVLLDLVKSDEEPLLISQLVRIADTSIALNATWELLHFASVNNDQLAILQRNWEQIDLLPGAERALEVERALLEQEADRMRNSSANYRTMTGLSRTGTATSAGTWLEDLGHEIAAKAHESAWRYCWSYPDELRSLKGQQAVLDAVRSIRAGKSFKDAIAIENLAVVRAGIRPQTNDDNSFFLFGSSDPRTLLSQSVLSVQKFPIRLLRMEAGQRLVVTAVALERFKLAHDKYPESLSALVPQYLAAVPLDPVDNQPLRYHQEQGTNYLMYSIGSDGVDDGGDSTPPAGSSGFPWLTAKDQVWPQAASEQEIESLLKKPRRKE